VANYHLCNHTFQNLYEITESGDAERALFAAVTRKHQIEDDRVIGGIGSAVAVTMMRDALLSTGLYVCLACAAPVLGALYQRREARGNVHTTQHTFTDTAAAIPFLVTLAGVVRVVVSESETISAGSMLVASYGQMATDSAPRRSQRVTPPPTRRLNASQAYVAPTALLRNVACELKAVTAEMRAIGLRPDGNQMQLKQVSASRAL